MNPELAEVVAAFDRDIRRKSPPLSPNVAATFSEFVHVYGRAADSLLTISAEHRRLSRYAADTLFPRSTPPPTFVSVAAFVLGAAIDRAMIGTLPRFCPTPELHLSRPSPPPKLIMPAWPREMRHAI